MTPPRKAKASEYPDLIAFLNGIFHKRMDLEYSHIYQPTAKDMANNIIVLEGGRIVSCVGIFPMTFVCGDARLSVGGVGGVSTDPEHRGRGLMTKLLDKAIAQMRRQSYDISILWGDRLRYNYFGWENAGRHYSFNINRRHVVRTTASGAEIRPLSMSGDDLGRIARFYEEWELRVERSPAELRSVFSRGTYETWVWRKGERFAYVTIKGTLGDRDLIEFGGDMEGLDNLLGFLFDRYDMENLAGALPFCQSPYLPFIISRSSAWGIGLSRRINDAMVKILDLASVLRKFAGEIMKKSRGLGLKGSLTLEMSDSGQFATLLFGRSVTVADRKANPVLSLSDTSMVRLIFGPVPPSHALGLAKPLRYLDALFPLDFYVPRLNYV